MVSNNINVKIHWEISDGGGYKKKYAIGFVKNRHQSHKAFTIIRPTNYGTEPYEYELRCHLFGLGCYKCRSANDASIKAKNLLRYYIKTFIGKL